MAVKYEVTAVTGKYTDREGKEKSRYAKLGVVMETKNGFMLKLESIPIGWDGWAYLNEPRQDEKPQNVRRSSSETARVADMSDDVPF
jgi:hypothetical protein